MIFFILYWQYFKVQTIVKGAGPTVLLKRQYIFLLSWICKHFPSLKLAFFSVTITLIVFVGLARRKKTVLAYRPVFPFFQWPITRASLATATAYLSVSFLGSGRVDKFSLKISVIHISMVSFNYWFSLKFFDNE